MSQLQALIAQGFDRSSTIPFQRAWTVRCSQCEALCINGIPTHEHGCPHQVYECRGCGDIVTRTGTYCADCR